MHPIWLSVYHWLTMLAFLLILVDCVWNQVLMRIIARFLPKKRKETLNRRRLGRIKSIYERHEGNLKIAASKLVKAQIADGEF